MAALGPNFEPGFGADVRGQALGRSGVLTIFSARIAVQQRFKSGRLPDLYGA